MKKLLTIVTILTCFIGNSQCEIKIIENEDSYYKGCVNFEGKPDGDGNLKVQLKNQSQSFDGIFKNGVFISGEVSVIFDSGDMSLTTYSDYSNEIISKEVVTFSDKSQLITFYESGKKVKDLRTFGPGDNKGLVIERFYLDGVKISENSNIDNNRVPEDIVGDEKYIDINLIQDKNEYRIEVDFLALDGTSFTVPIKLDTGATDFFIGQNLYQELLKKCDITDLNVIAKMGGVGSSFKAKHIKIKEIKIGDYLIKNVIAIVPLEGEKDNNGDDINNILFGIDIMKKFKEVTWSLTNNKLRFVK